MQTWLPLQSYNEGYRQEKDESIILKTWSFVQMARSQVLGQSQVGTNLLKLRNWEGLGAHSQLPALKGVRGVCRKLQDQTRKRDKLLSYSVLHPKPTNKLVITHFAHFQCWDKPRATLDSLDSPRPGFNGSHHLPPYSILCVSPLHLHLNDIFSRDSQSGVPKLSRFRLPGLWAFITSRPDFGFGRGLKQSCISPRELSNNVSHFT